MNYGLAKFGVVLGPISFFAELAKGDIDQFAQTVDDVARSDGIKMISCADLLNFVCTKTLDNTFVSRKITSGPLLQTPLTLP